MSIRAQLPSLASIAASLVLATALAGCDPGFEYDEDAFEELGAGIGETFGEGLACTLIDAFIVTTPLESKDGTSGTLGGWGDVPLNVATNSEVAMTIQLDGSFETIDLALDGPGVVASDDQDLNHCPPSTAGTFQILTAKEEGPLMLHVSSDGVERGSITVNVLEPATLEISGAPVHPSAGDSFAVRAHVSSDEGEPIFPGFPTWTIVSGPGRVTPLLDGSAAIACDAAGELVVGVEAAGLSSTRTIAIE